MKRTYNFGPDQVQSIERLAARCSMDKTDVLTNGLRLFREAVKASQAGQRIAIVDAQGRVSPLIGPWSDLAEQVA